MKPKYRHVHTAWKSRNLLAHPTRLFALFKDERTPLLAKVLPVIAIGYLLLPIDILPDFIPFLGQVDDLTIAFTLLSLAISMVPPEVFSDLGIEPPKTHS